MCAQESQMKGESIQCSDCLAWCHFACTKLPGYQLYIYKTSSRKYKCEKCSNCPQEYTVESKFNTKSTQTVLEYCESETQTVVDNLFSTKDTLLSEPFESVMVKLLDQISDINRKMENCKLNQVNTCTTINTKDLNLGNEEINSELKSECTKLKHEVKDLNTKCTKLQQEVKEVCGRNVKLEKEYLEVKKKQESDIHEWRSKFSNNVIEYEIEKSKLQGEIQVKEVKISCLTHSTKVLETEMKSLEARFEKKCKEVEDLEEKIRNLKVEKYDQESVLNIIQDKHFNCDNDIRMNQMHNKTTSVKHNNARQEFPGNIDEIYHSDKSHSNTSDTSNKQAASIRESSETSQEKATFVGKKIQSNSQQKDARTTEQTNSRNITNNILMVGTSNTNYLSAKFMADNGRNNLYVKKTIKYSVKDTKEYIQGYEGVSPDMVAFLVTCNDLEKNSCNTIVQEMVDLIETTNSTFDTKPIPIVVSLPLPRRERAMNSKAQQLSAALRNRLCKFQNITFSENSNLTYRGVPLDGILSDKKHLSKWGTRVLARNLRDDFADVMNKRQ